MAVLGDCTLHIIAPGKSDSQELDSFLAIHCSAAAVAVAVALFLAFTSNSVHNSVGCSGPSNNFLYGSHYSRDGHYHLGNRFPLQLLQKTPTDQLQ